MGLSTRIAATAASALVAPLLFATSGGAAAPVELVSVSSTSVHKTQTSYVGVVSRNGRYVAFLSFADFDSRVNVNLPYPSMYLRDRVAGTTTLVSVSYRGDAGALGPMAPAGISDDGRYVAISGNADLLTQSDGRSHVYVRDMVAGTVIRADVSDTGVPANGASYAGGYAPFMTPDGRFLAFSSEGSNLVPGDTNGWSDVFVRDLVAGTTRRASLSTSGAQPNYPVTAGGVSDDGRFVVLDSPASNLVPGDTNAGCPGACGIGGDIFVRDMAAGTTERVSVASDGTQTDDSGGRQSSGAAISGDGRFVAFMSGATNLVPADHNDALDAFLHDRSTHTTTRLSLAADGAELPHGGATVTISHSANAALFTADDASAAPGFPAGTRQLVRRTLATGTNTLATVDADGNAVTSGPRTSGSISGDGGIVVFDTDQALVAADQGGNADVYLVQLTPPAAPPAAPPIAAITAGDHSATVTWLKPADGGAPILGYLVTATPGGQSCSTSDADALSCTINGLTNGVDYTFTVTARNAAGSGPPASSPPDRPVTVGAPPSPVVVLPPEPDPSDGTRVTLRWLAAQSDPNLPVTGYRATAQPGGQSCSTTGALFCTITGLTPGQHYAFTVTAENGVGGSGPSEPVEFPSAADVATTVNTSAPSVALGDAFTSTVVVTGNGPDPATAVTTAITFAGSAVSLLAVATTTGTCTLSPTAVTCSLGPLAAGASATVTVVAEPNATGVVTVTATSQAQQRDPVSANNTASRSVTVGNAHGCTIVGTPGDDTISGTNGNDVICALGGDDHVNGGNGDDIIYGGSGADTLDGGNGNDTIRAGTGGSVLLGGNGNDLLYGGAGDDTIYGDNGNDTIDAGAGNDTVYGGNGNDTVDGGDGNDTVDGGTGNDVCPHTEHGTSCA